MRPQTVNQTQGSGLTFAMVTHSDEGSFWSVVKKGAQQAAQDEGVKLIWSPSNNDPQKEAQLIDAAVSQKVDGLAVSVPNASAIKDSLAKAKAAGIPIITLNSGADDFKALGAITHVGQTETIAGRRRAQRLKADGVKKVLCVIHEQNNIGLQQRCDGVKQGFGGSVTNLQVKGTADIATTQTEIKSKLQADKSYDGVITLNPDIAAAAKTAIKRRVLEREARDVRPQPARPQGHPVGRRRVRRRPAAVPAGLPAGRVPEAVPPERQHGRRRPAGPDRPGLRRQDERRDGPEADRGGHALAIGGYAGRPRGGRRPVLHTRRDT